jgi:hypothetical protein
VIFSLITPWILYFDRRFSLIDLIDDIMDLRSGGSSDPYFEIRKGHGTVWVKVGNRFVQQQYVAPVAGMYSGTINSRSGTGDISLVSRSNIVKNSLNPTWITVKFPLSRYFEIVAMCCSWG